MPAPAHIDDFVFTLRMINAGRYLYDKRVPLAIMTHVADIYRAMQAHDPDPKSLKNPTPKMLEAGLAVFKLPRPASKDKPRRVLDLYYMMRLQEPKS